MWCAYPLMSCSFVSVSAELSALTSCRSRSCSFSFFSHEIVSALLMNSG